MTRLRPLLTRLAPVLLLIAVTMLVAACGSLVPGASHSPTPSPTPQQPLAPHPLGATPWDLLAWAFTPIFQTLFLALVVLDRLTGNMVIAIILLTIIITMATYPLTKKQLISTRQTQLLQPELKEIQRKFKGDRTKASAAQQEFYKQRGINPAGGCLPTLLTMGLLIPMYSVFSGGLTNYDITGMLHPLGIDLAAMLNITCPPAPILDAAGHVTNACLDPWAFGINWSYPEPFTTGLYIAGFGFSFLAIISSLFQLVSSRQMLPPLDPRMADDPNAKVQRQMAYFLPFISLIYGGMLPAGLFLYWIVSSIIRIGQQFQVFGFGAMFPLFGWHPAFAAGHRPRHHVTLPQPKPIEPGSKASSAAERSKNLDRDLSAQATIRPNRSKQSGRRGRRR
ncbi:MAG: YidC/Oxa1 family membrane protein insertase [Chloroflexota bacterium]